MTSSRAPVHIQVVQARADRMQRGACLQDAASKVRVLDEPQLRERRDSRRVMRQQSAESTRFF